MLMSFKHLKDPIFYFYLLATVYLVLVIWKTIAYVAKPLEITSQPELVGQYNITGDSYTKRTLQVYRIDTNQGQQLITTEWRE